MDAIEQQLEDLQIRINALKTSRAKYEARIERIRFRGEQVDMIRREYKRQYNDWDDFYKHLDAEIEIEFICQQSNDYIIEDWEFCEHLFACPYHAILSDILISLRIDAYTYEDSLIPILRNRYSNNN